MKPFSWRAVLVGLAVCAAPFAAAAQGAGCNPALSNSAYAAGAGCLMRFLQQALDDPDPAGCGRCSVWTGQLPGPGARPGRGDHRHGRSAPFKDQPDG